MKEVQKHFKRAICIIVMLSMIAGSLSGCGWWEKPASDVISQETVTEVTEITLSSMGQDSFLLLAGGKPGLQFSTTGGTVADIAVTPEDKALEPYKYYTVTVTLAAKDNESFTKSAVITMDGVELKVKEWSKDKLVIEYTALALPETIMTEAMSKVSSYGNAKDEKAIGTAKVQALLDCELTVFSEDGKNAYVVEKGFVPLFMIPSFVANGELEQIKDGKSVQIIAEHGEGDFPGAQGQWYKIAFDGKVGYLPVSFVKDVKITENPTVAEKTPESKDTTETTVPTKPAKKPAVNQDKPTTTPAAKAESGTKEDDSDDESNDEGGNSTGNGAGNGAGNGSDSNIQQTTYYQVSFALGGGISSEDALLPDAIMVQSNSVISLNQLATPSVPGYLFDSWFYDSALTRQVQNGDTINENMTLYAKLREITGEEVYAGVDSYVSSVDVDAANFAVAVLKPARTRSTESVAEMVSLHDVANPEASLAVQISEPETVLLEDIAYEKYLISSKELEEGATYQMRLLSDSYVFYYEDQIQAAAVRLYNFTTKMSAVENLELNSNLIYLKKAEVSYTEGSDYLSGLFNATVEDDITQLNTVEGSGSFIYTGNQPVNVGTTVVIYDGAEAPGLGENGLASAEQYDGNAAYLTVSKVVGNEYYYGVAEAEEVLFTPDVLPVNTADDEDGRDNFTVTIDTEKLSFSGSTYGEMGLDENTTVDVGDYLAFFSGDLATATELTYGRITAISVSGENTVLTYEVVEESEVLEAMTVYSTEAMEFELDEDTAAAIEDEMEKDAIDSGFAMEAANYLATVALATEELQALSDDMGLQSLTYTMENGSAATQSDLQLMAGSNVKVEGLKVKANVSRQLENLGDKASNYNKNGVRAQLEVSFNIIIGSGENKLVLKVGAVFEQEVLLDLNIKGKAIWGKKWIFPYIKDYRITTNLDVGTYTGIGITATVVTDNQPEYDWSTVNKNLSDQIHELMNNQDQFFNQKISSIGGGLAGKYAAMLENNAEWVNLVEVKIFSAEAKILAGVIVVGVQADFVVSAKVNIMLGMTFEYGVAKRYTFTLNVFAKTSSSDTVDLEKSHYNFDMYVMGTIGIRAGVRLTVYAGVFSKKVAAIGVSAEAGAYIQLWGYFYYSNSWESGSGKSTSVSGAMLMEVGAYLEIRFLATAFGGAFAYNPILYDKYWPLWNMGSVENVYDFNYETTAGVADSKDINMGANTSVALPTDRMNMAYMNLRDGKTDDKTYTYSDFTITTTGNFTYENGVIKVIPQDGSSEEKGTIKLTWNGAPLSFTSKPLSCEMDITWSDPSRKHSVSYQLHGGTAIENGSVLADGIPGIEIATGGRITAPSAEVKRDCYTFGGWYADEACTTPWHFETDKVTANLVLHAKWTPITYEITYELNGGSNSSSNPVTYTVEDAVTLQAATRAGYQFAGWNTAADGTGSNVTGLPVGSSGAKKFYAQWIAGEQTYEIHHMLEALDGSYEDKETSTATARTGETVTVGEEQSKAYTGFTYDATLTTESTGIIPGEGTLVLKLYYSRNSYDVTFVSGTDTKPIVEKVAYQDKVKEPEKPSREGYDFTGWFAVAEAPRLWDFAEDVITGATELRAGWSAKEYNVTFDMQGGSGGNSNVTVTYGSAMTAISVPARAGYQFLGYFDQAEGGTQYYNADGSSARIWDKAEPADGANSFVLYAKWQANTYQVAFDANGGSGSMEEQSFTYDIAQALTANRFTRTGYTFAGWAKAANAEKADYADKESIMNLTATKNETVTLYAVWSPVTYTVAFDGNGATDGSMDGQVMTYDVAAALHANGYQKTGYHFVGWATTESGAVSYQEGASVSNLANVQDANITLYAVWEANTYTVAFYANGGNGTMENQSFTYDEAAKALSTNLYSKTGYQFMGWATTSTATSAEYADGQAVQNLMSAQQGLLTLYAVWQANSYTVSFDSNKGSGSSTPTTAEPATVTYGMAYGTLPTVKRTGYDFVGWYTQETEGTVITAESVVDVTTDITLYARWTAKKYDVSFDSNQGSGSSIPTTAAKIEVTYDDTYVSLPTVSRDGYTFNGWYTQASGGTKIEASNRISLTEHQTLYAQWKVNSYKVTYNANGGSFADGTTSKDKTLSYDNSYELPDAAPTRDGYTFQGWFTASTGGTQVNAGTIMVTAKEHTLYAQWKSVEVNHISVKVGNVTLDYSGTAVYAKTDSAGKVTAGGSEEDYNIKLENGVLTLKNAVITYAPVSTYHNGALSATGDLTITLAEGTTNKVTNTSANSGSAWNCGIYVDGNLTINGSGSLTANGGNGYSSHGISVEHGTLIIDGATVTAIGGDAEGSSGIYTGKNVEMKNYATVHAVGGKASGGFSYGIESDNRIIITNSRGSAKGVDGKDGTHAMSKQPTYSGAETTSGAYNEQAIAWNIVSAGN